MKQKLKFVVHYCKNPKCNNCWTDVDLTNAQIRPPKWKYCRECCEKLGIDFDAQIPQKKKLSQKQIEVLKKNQFVKRKNSSDLNDIHQIGIEGDKNEY